MAQVKKPAKRAPSALRGKFVKTEKLVGRVLNDPEKDPFIVLHVLRERFVEHNSAISQMAGWAPTSVWWEARDKEINTTREQLGPFEVLDRMPEGLHSRYLNRRSGAPSVTVVGGRRYVNW